MCIFIGTYSATFQRQSPRGEPYAQACLGEPGRGRPQGARDRQRPAHRQDEHGGRSRRAERVRNAHLRTPSRTSTGRRYAPTTRLSGSRERFVGGPASWEHSPTASHASTWRPHDCATSSAPHGKCYMNMRPSTTSKTAPRDARELVGKRDRQHIVMQPLLGYLDPRLEPVAFPSVRLHLHKRDPCCKYGTPRLRLISRMRHSCLVANVCLICGMPA